MGRWRVVLVAAAVLASLLVATRSDAARAARLCGRALSSRPSRTGRSRSRSRRTASPIVQTSDAGPRRCAGRSQSAPERRPRRPPRATALIADAPLVWFRADASRAAVQDGSLLVRTRIRSTRSGVRLTAPADGVIEFRATPTNARARADDRRDVRQRRAPTLPRFRRAQRQRRPDGARGRAVERGRPVLGRHVPPDHRAGAGQAVAGPAARSDRRATSRCRGRSRVAATASCSTRRG